MAERGARNCEPFTRRSPRRTFPMSTAAPAQQSQTQQTPNNLLIAVLSLFIFLPLGALAVVNAVKVNKLTAEGKHDEAMAASAGAKKYAYIAIITGVVVSMMLFIAKVMSGS